MRNFVANLLMSSVAMSAVVLTASCGSAAGNDAAGIVDVGNVIGNLSDVTTSCLGKSIRFVPLETCDSSLVAADWTLFATDDRVVIANTGNLSYDGMNADVLVFGLDDGRFIAGLGQPGSGPEDYLLAFPAIDSAGEFACFGAGNGKGWVRYGLDGAYEGKILPELEVQGNYLACLKDTIAYFMYNDYSVGTRRVLIRRRGFSGAEIDSLVMFEDQAAEPFSLTFDGPVSFYSHNAPFSNTRRDILEIVGGDRHLVLPGRTISMVGEEMHYDEKMCDTIYRITPDGPVVSLLFDMGPDGFPFNELNKRPVKPSELVLTNILETPALVLFSVARGLPADDNSNTYIGLYDRSSGTTVMGAGIDGIRDDLGGFMPFNPVSVTPSGKFIGVLTMDAIDEWMESHPDAILPESLRDYDPEGNPVLVIID